MSRKEITIPWRVLELLKSYKLASDKRGFTTKLGDNERRGINILRMRSGKLPLQRQTHPTIYLFLFQWTRTLRYRLSLYSRIKSSKRCNIFLYSKNGDSKIMPLIIIKKKKKKTLELWVAFNYVIRQLVENFPCISYCSLKSPSWR